MSPTYCAAPDERSARSTTGLGWGGSEGPAAVAVVRGWRARSALSKRWMYIPCHPNTGFRLAPEKRESQEPGRLRAGLTSSRWNMLTGDGRPPRSIRLPCCGPDLPSLAQSR